MALLQGNTYLLPIRIEDCEGDIVRDEQVERGEFVVGEITKFYGVGGEVVWSEEQQAFIMPLTEQETFGFKKGAIKYQGRVYLKDGSVSGSVPTSEYVYESIGTTILSDGGVGEDSGKVLTIRLLDRVINTGITEEVDPTVPQYVKEITEQDIENWNKVNKLGNVFKYKGSVQTYADLPTENNQVGDVWNVVEKYESYPAGTNFAWTPDGTWDALGGITEVVETLAETIRDNTVQIVPTSGGLAIGGAIKPQNSDAIAIGINAQTDAARAIQLGTGTNTTANSFQIFDDNIYKADTHTLTVQNAQVNGNNVYGVLQGETDPTEATVGAVGQFYISTATDPASLWLCTKVETVDSTTTYTWTKQGGVSQEEFDKLVNNGTQIKTDKDGFNAGGAIGVTNTATGCVVIGKNAYASTNDAIAIGRSAQASYYIAIGANAISSQPKSIQLGNGNNSTPNSLQIFNDNIYNANTHTLTVQNIELNGVDLGTQLGDLNTALETILGV